MQTTLMLEHSRLRRLSHPWSSVRGPAGAFALTLGRIGWAPESASVLLTRSGQRIDLRDVSPRLVGKLAERDAEITAWHPEVGSGRLGDLKTPPGSGRSSPSLRRPSATPRRLGV